jgi:hypothetical protein
VSAALVCLKHEKSRFRHEVVTHACVISAYRRGMGTKGRGDGREALEPANAERRKARKVATPWGPAELLDEVLVRQRAGEQRFASHVQLLAGAKGERLVRFAYSTGGTARRGPVTLRARELEKLRTALAERPELGELFGVGGGA